MNFEPQKFFIGLVDFFSILLPGALLAYLGKDWVGRTLLHQNGFALEGSEHIAVFLFASYLLGHFAFLVGTFLDEWIYDPLRSTTRWGQIGRLANNKSLRPRLIRQLAQSDILFGKSADAAVMKIQQMKTLTLNRFGGGRAVNSYQWCKALLSKEHSDGLLAVQRFEADSKFFRSFVVVLFPLAIILLIRQQWVWGLICFGLFIPALLRYIDQRFKGTQQAYWFVITFEGLKDKPMETAGERKADRPTHAGGVVYQKREGTLTYLLVTASDDRERLVLPKGHIEPGEDERETAVREVMEESNNWARVEQWLDDVKLGESALTRVYLMEFIEQVDSDKKPREEDRQQFWLTAKEAKSHKIFDETKKVIAQAEAKLTTDKKLEG